MKGTTYNDYKEENIKIDTEKDNTKDLKKDENISDEKDNAEPLVTDIKEFYKHSEGYEISKYGVCYKELIRD